MRLPGGALTGYLVARAVSQLGSVLSLVALPWFVLTSTGSPTLTGITSFAEMLPYVGARVLSGPMIDRAGPRRTSIAADALSTVVVASVPVLHLAHMLGFGPLLVLVAAAGLVRGVGDTAKVVLLPDAVDESRVSLTRATSLADGTSRLATLLGSPLAGVLIAAVGAADVLFLDAASFAFAAAAIAACIRARRTTPDPEAEDEGHYLARIVSGMRWLRGDGLMVAIVAMLFLTNLLDAAMTSVLVPVWARVEAGTPVALGLVYGALGVGAVAGNTIMAAIGDRLPRRVTYTVCFLVLGAPRCLAMAFSDDMWVVVPVMVLAGLAAGAINPILSTVSYERVPRAMQGRVLGATGGLSWAGIPLGGLIAGPVVAGAGLPAALALTGAIYLAATLVPLLPGPWAQMDRRITG